jgi:hypothetical protein
VSDPTTAALEYAAHQRDDLIRIIRELRMTENRLRGENQRLLERAERAEAVIRERDWMSITHDVD